MIKATLIAKSSDGTLLYEQKPDRNASSDTFQSYSKSKDFLKTIANKPDRLSVEMSGGNTFNYTTTNGVTYAAICDKSCSQQLAFAYLTEAKREFIEELKKNLGESPEKKTETLTKPVDSKELEKKMEDLKDQYNSQKAQTRMQQLNAELAAVQRILKEDFELMMDRDKTLSSIGMKAADLKQKSSEFKGKSSHIKWQFIARTYYLFAVVIAIIGALAYYFFFA